MSPVNHARRSWLQGLSPKAQGVLAINISAVIFGTAALYGKLNVSPFWIVTIRAGFGALTLGLLGGYRIDLGGLAASLRSLTLSGALLAAHWLTFFVSVQQAGVAVATLTFATFPLFTVLVEAIHRRKLPRPVELAVGIVIIIAVALLVDPSGGQRNVGGAAAGLASALTYALFWRVGQRLGTALSPETIAFCQNSVVFALLAPTLFFAVPAPARAIEWASLAALGVFNTAVLLLLYLYALKRISPSTCSGFVALEPVYAIVFAALLFQEPVTPWIVVSIVLILGASLALLRLDNQPPPPIV
jgi:drug/metabolite transporter (DMT)-like permease